MHAVSLFLQIPPRPFLAASSLPSVDFLPSAAVTRSSGVPGFAEPLWEFLLVPSADWVHLLGVVSALGRLVL